MIKIGEIRLSTPIIRTLSDAINCSNYFIDRYSLELSDFIRAKQYFHPIKSIKIYDEYHHCFIFHNNFNLFFYFVRKIIDNTIHLNVHSRIFPFQKAPSINPLFLNSLNNFSDLLIILILHYLLSQLLMLKIIVQNLSHFFQFYFVNFLHIFIFSLFYMPLISAIF